MYPKVTPVKSGAGGRGALPGAAKPAGSVVAGTRPAV